MFAPGWVYETQGAVNFTRNENKYVIYICQLELQCFIVIKGPWVQWIAGQYITERMLKTDVKPEKVQKIISHCKIIVYFILCFMLKGY